MRDYLIQNHLHPHIQVISKRQSGSFFVKENFLFTLNGIPLCNEHYLHLIKSDKIHFAVGKLPPYTTANTDMPSLSSVLTHLRTVVQGKIEVLERQPCLKSHADTLVSVWELQLRVDGVRHFVQADDRQVYRLLRNDLQVVRYAYVRYPNINADEQMVKVIINSNGRLRNAYFFTQPQGDEPLRLSDNDNEEIRYDIDDPRYEELASYYFANVMLEFFQGLGYRWHSEYPLQLVLNQGLPHQIANARYEPPAAAKGASIIIERGKLLRNLATDFDVIAHEFAHHVIYRNVHANNLDSIALHEGLADYFTYAKTGDGCLAESVCTPYLQSCSLRNQCLRHAEAEGNIQDFEQHHERGEIIAAMLWGLQDQVPSMAQLVYTSLEMLSPNADQHELAHALMQADRQLFNGRHACIISDAFVARGVDVSFACENYVDIASLTDLSAEPAVASQSCAAIASHSNTYAYTLLLLLAPLLWLPLCRLLWK